MVLPLIVIIGLAALLGLLLVSTISVFIPAIGNWLWGVGLLIAAYFTKDMIVSKARGITVGSIAAILGLSIIALSLLKVNLPSFSVLAMSITQGETTSVATPNFLYPLILVGFLIYVFRKQLFKKSWR